ncbi:MAG: nitrate reductase molybdenum cofactor assembly chaperone [Acidimicrobiaceae bacterium]|nr:nitrate reductase molybdenum cofactor assembly chaperone [Acidimicrobiaceae bacterium]
MRRSVAARVFGCASVLLSYPDPVFFDDLDSVAAALTRLPSGPTRSRLSRTRDWLAGQTPMEAAAGYVETFDLRRRRSLHLTWYRHGDTRERGMALAALAEVYRGAGVRIAPGELPDFLPALLELAALEPAGAAVLGEHRAALDALAGELSKQPSPYAEAITAVTDALGGASRADRDALRRYRREGPPSERVGLEPFAPPEMLGHALTERSAGR